MTYTPTVFVNNVTPYNAGEGNKMGSGIQAVHVLKDRFDETAMAAAGARQVLAYFTSSSKWGPLTLLSTDIPAWVRKVITATTYTMAADDGGKLLEFTAGTAVTVTLPTQASVTTPADMTGGWCQYGAGVVTFVAATGVSRSSRGSAFSTAGQYAEGGWRRRGTTDEWVISGDLVV